MVAKVSIIVPIYRIKEVYLRKCIGTLIDQTMKEIQILLVDDGSPDSCGQICDEYAAQDERITVIHQQNHGVSVARNIGVDQAAGEYILFVDPDDWLELSCCESVFKEIEEQECDVLFFQGLVETGQGSYHEVLAEETRRLSRDEIRILQLDTISLGKFHYGVDRATPWGRLIRRRFIIENRIHFMPGIKKQQDLLWHLYLYEYLEKACVMDYTGYHYRVHQDSVCTRYNPDMLENINNVHYEILNFIKQFHPNEKDYERALGLCRLNNVGSILNTQLFHPDHNVSYRQVKKVLNAYIDDELYVEYIKKISYKDLPTRKLAIRAFLLIHHCFLAFYIYQKWTRK